MTKKHDRVPSVKSVMTPFPWSVSLDDSLTRARRLMDDHDIRHLPVVEEDRLVGVISDRDLGVVRAAVPEGEARESLTVRDACILDAYVVESSTPLDRVLLEMSGRHIGSALVVRNGRLAGIFTVTDACRHFGLFLREMFPPGGDDEVA